MISKCILCHCKANKEERHFLRNRKRPYTSPSVHEVALARSVQTDSTKYKTTFHHAPYSSSNVNQNAFYPTPAQRVHRYLNIFDHAGREADRPEPSFPSVSVTMPGGRRLKKVEMCSDKQGRGQVGWNFFFKGRKKRNTKRSKHCTTQS